MTDLVVVPGTTWAGRVAEDLGLLATGGVIAALPPVVIAFAFQRYIVAGLTTGGVKG